MTDVVCSTQIQPHDAALASGHASPSSTVQSAEKTPNVAPMQRQMLLDLGHHSAPEFANFLVGRNTEALTAIEQLAHHHQDPASADTQRAAQRLIYLWGVPGSGRSHLLRALAAACDVPVLTPDLASDLPESSGGLWLIDDIDRLDAAGQVALFRLFNALQLGHGSLVLSGPCAPRDLPLRADLRTRVGLMLMFELHELADAEKIAALRQRASSRGTHVPDEVLRYLVSHMPRDMTTLAQWIDALDAWSMERHRPVTVPMVRELLANVQQARLQLTPIASLAMPPQVPEVPLVLACDPPKVLTLTPG